MPDKTAAHWDNYWQGRASKQSGNALVEVGVENNHALKQFWRDAFSPRDKSEKIIDFACGAGSVLEHAHDLGFANLTGVDVSPEALKVMQEKIPPAIGICSRVDDVPQDANSYNLAVSQFGVEYAGERDQLSQTFEEMHRILKPGGRITIIAHAKGGLIYNGCSTSLKNSKIIQDSGFIEISKNAVLILHDQENPKENQKLQNSMSALNQAAEPIMAWLKTADRAQDKFAQFAYFILQSSHKLITNHTAYSREESLDWYSGIQMELEAYDGRMLSMTKAALSETEISELVQSLKAAGTGLTFQPAEEFYFPPNTAPAAWVIRASKD